MEFPGNSQEKPPDLTVWHDENSENIQTSESLNIPVSCPKIEPEHLEPVPVPVPKLDVDSCFFENPHPPIETMIDISEQFQVKFKEVYEHFDYLRYTNDIRCPYLCICDWIRYRLYLYEPPVDPETVRGSIRNVCTEVFNRLDPQKDIDDGHVLLILLNNASPWRHFSPAGIRFEWLNYRKDLLQLMNISKNKFPFDLEYFETNPHPTSAQMQSISIGTGVEYRTIYLRFEEMRYAKRAVCRDGDTCQLIRKYSADNQTDTVISENVMIWIKEELEKVCTAQNSSPGHLSLHVIHTLIERLQMKSSVIRRVWTDIHKRKPTATIVRGQKTMILDEDVEYALTKEFEANPFMTTYRLNKLSEKFSVMPRRIRALFDQLNSRNS